MSEESRNADRNRGGRSTTVAAVDGDADLGPAVVGLDRSGRITAWSTPAEHRYGYAAAEVRGRPLGVLFSDPADADELLARDGRAIEVGLDHERADGSTFRGSAILVPLSGDCAGYTLLVDDAVAADARSERLQQRNDRLVEFSGALAHDLRSPLSLIEGRVELARETDGAEHLDAIDRTVERMNRLVDDLLRVARHAEPIVEFRSVDVGDLLDAAWEGTGGAASGATLQYEPVPKIRADGAKLCELLENLIENAVRHGGDAVTVSVGPLADGFYVADDGPGVPDEVRATAFDHGVTTTEDGTGYGLSVVETIAAAHGWDVTLVESESGGARFELTGVEFPD